MELHQALVFVVSRPRQGEFVIEQGPLAIEHIDIIRRPTSIAHE
jgi:hypothetical protein